ncbi:pentapeptide repeat-containing protein [Geodermatophilus poikilotrophus]|nr:pentapeptide repeat-containing protein [Geodermatophilus poikilotrophus]
MQSRPRYRPRLLRNDRKLLDTGSGSALQSSLTPPVPPGGRVASFFHQHGYAMARDVLVALLAVGVTFTLDSRIATRQEQADERRAAQQEALENLRFVRDRAGDPVSIKPFNGIRLHEANLSGLALGCEEPQAPNCASFVGADMRSADLSFVNLTNAELTHSNLSGARLLGAQLAGADINDAELDGANLLGADLTGANLHDSELHDTDLFSAELSGAQISFAHLHNASLRDANLFDSDLSYSSLFGADLTGANLTNAVLTNVNLTEANLTGAVLTDVCFDDKTTWPSGYRRPATPSCET